MAEVVLPIENVRRRWHKDIPGLLGPLVPNRQHITCTSVSRANQIVIGAHNGPKPIALDFRQWSFRTTHQSLRANYFEIWLPEDAKTQFFYLNRSYLSIRKLDEYKQENDIFVLHCDPNELDTEPHAAYKQLPHVHVMTADSHLRHAHLTLNSRLQKQSVLASCAELMVYMSEAVHLIADEVVQSHP